MTHSIRDLGTEDKALWLPLWHGYLTFYKTVLTDEQTDLTWNRLLDPEFNLYAKVLEQDGKLVGLTHYSFQTSTWATKNYCYLEDLFVSPELRGQGLGRALIDCVKEIAIKEGSSRLYWNTDRTNETARKLYDTYTPESGKVQYRVLLNPDAD
jgi:GNAT superfamily N-acetyltransferase